MKLSLHAKTYIYIYTYIICMLCVGLKYDIITI